ncbi:hypothetical protein [Aliamphritea spongicola]|nr:hypothetical protein [Aliamphritea spongicola]
MTKKSTDQPSLNQKAIALNYDHASAPKLVAKGRGSLLSRLLLSPMNTTFIFTRALSWLKYF